MKMKELEARSGIGRETIRFYIREGLLPEPERPKPNVAIYSEAHIRRLEAIRMLQRERFLPLSVIKRLLDEAGERALEAMPGLFGLEFMLAARLGADDARAPVDAERLAAETGIPLEEIRTLAARGILALETDAGGRPVLSAPDAAVIQLWGRINATGFTREAGYTADDLAKYHAVAEQLATFEVDDFYDRVADGLDADRAATMAIQGMAAALEIVGHLRARGILRRVAARNAEAMAAGPGAAAPGAAAPGAAGSTDTPAKRRA